MGVFIAVNYEPDPPSIPEKSVLWLDLNRPVTERPEPGLLGEGQGTVFRDMILAIDKAIDDPRIEGVAAQLGGSSLSIAQAQELSRALIELKTAGKSSVAFAEDLGSGWNGTVDYMLAASFGELWLQPSGGVGLSGLAIEMPFFRDALDEYGVSPQFEQRYEFKGGVDPYVETG